MMKIIAKKPSMTFDIMSFGKFCGQITLRCIVGMEYTDEELIQFAKELRPSLVDKDFNLLPTDNRVFKN